LAVAALDVSLAASDASNGTTIFASALDEVMLYSFINKVKKIREGKPATNKQPRSKLTGY